MTTTTASPAAGLLARLDDPATAAALHQLLDHAQLIAFAAGSADGLLRRSETITDNLVSGLSEFRTASAASLGPTGDLRDGAGELAALLPALVRAAPTLRVLLDSVSSGVEEAGEPLTRQGLRALVADLRGLDVRHGLRVVLGVARALGRSPGRAALAAGRTATSTAGRP